MPRDSRHGVAENKLMRLIKEFFCYDVVHILPMSAEQRNRWERARARGFLRYVLQSTLVNVLTGTVVIGIMWLIVVAILDGERRHQASTFLLIPYSVLLLGGWVGPCFRWWHNEAEYRRPPSY